MSSITASASPAPRPTPGEDPRFSRWDGVLALLMGAALLLFGWMDTRSFLASLHKMPFTFSLNSRPGGFRVEPDQEFFCNAYGDSVRLENFTALELSGKKSIRHPLGPVSTLEIRSPHSRVQLGLRFGNIIQDQDLAIACNGQPLEQFTHLPVGPETGRLYALTLHPGSNVVTFTWRHFLNDGTPENASDDHRPVAGAFGAMDLCFE